MAAMLVRDVLKLIPDNVLVHVIAKRDDGSVFRICFDPCRIVRTDEGELQNLEVLRVGAMKSREMLHNKEWRTNADMYVIGRLQEDVVTN